MLLSNNEFTPAAELLAKPNGVYMVNRLLLENMIKDKNITIRDIYKQEAKRMKIV